MAWRVPEAVSAGVQWVLFMMIPQGNVYAYGPEMWLFYASFILGLLCWVVMAGVLWLLAGTLARWIVPREAGRIAGEAASLERLVAAGVILLGLYLLTTGISMLPMALNSGWFTDDPYMNERSWSYGLGAGGGGRGGAAGPACG